MYPLSLTLKGFRGIRDGLGMDVLTLDLERLAGDAELVALAGANGRGKSTILDNLHPFLVMPSRGLASGAFPTTTMCACLRPRRICCGCTRGGVTARRS